MYSIRQESLFSLEQLLEMSPDEKYGWIFVTIAALPVRMQRQVKRPIHG